MMLTEKEARLKYCPVLGTEEDSLPDPVTDKYGVAPLLCRGADCMAWRRGRRPEPLTIPHNMSADERHRLIEKALPDPPRPEGVPESYVFIARRDEAFWGETRDGQEARRKGYCGLIGLPEGAE